MKMMRLLPACLLACAAGVAMPAQAQTVKTLSAEKSNTEQKEEAKPIVIEGKAVDANTGKPITNMIVTVGLSWQFGDDKESIHTNWFEHGMMGEYSVVQNEDGYKVIFKQDDEMGMFMNMQADDEDGPKQMVALRVVAPGYYPVEKTGMDPEKSPLKWDIKLEPAPMRSGVIQSKDGKPIWNAAVQLVNAKSGLQIFGPVVLRQGYRQNKPIMTDLKGRFELPAVRPPFKLVVLAPEGYCLIDHMDIKKDTAFTLEPWQEVSGSTSQLGKPVPAQHVSASAYLVPKDNPDRYQITFAANTFSDQRGNFRFPFVPNQDIKLTWQKGQIDEYDYSSSAVMSELAQPGSAPVNFDLTGHIVVGQLVNHEKETFKGGEDSYISTNAYIFNEDTETRKSINVSDDGTFVLYNIEPGKLSLTATMEISNYRTDEEEVFTFNYAFEVKDDSANVVELADIVPDKKAKVVGVGSEAPDFSFRVLNPKSPLKPDNAKLSDYKGKYVLLDFWATWCGPCLAETPNVVKTYEAFKDQNLVVISLSLDDNMIAPLNYIKKKKIEYVPGYLGDWAEDTVTDLYNVRGIPSIFLIDPNGFILAQNLRGNNIYKTVEKHISPTD